MKMVVCMEEQLDREELVFHTNSRNFELHASGEDFLIPKLNNTATNRKFSKSYVQSCVLGYLVP